MLDLISLVHFLFSVFCFLFSVLWLEVRGAQAPLPSNSKQLTSKKQTIGNSYTGLRVVLEVHKSSGEQYASIYYLSDSGTTFNYDTLASNKTKTFNDSLGIPLRKSSKTLSFGDKPKRLVTITTTEGMYPEPNEELVDEYQRTKLQGQYKSAIRLLENGNMIYTRSGSSLSEWYYNGEISETTSSFSLTCELERDKS